MPQFPRYTAAVLLGLLALGAFAAAAMAYADTGIPLLAGMIALLGFLLALLAAGAAYGASRIKGPIPEAAPCERCGRVNPAGSRYCSGCRAMY